MSPDCPRKLDLQRFVDRSMSDLEATDTELHLDSCTICAEELGRLLDGPGGYIGLALELMHPRAASAVGGPPEVVGYEVLECIGRGGMGVVYRARHAKLRRILALKVLRTGLVGVREAEQRFFAEARVNAGLQHPCIAPVHELGTTADGRPYFSMKLIGGLTLERWLARRPADGSDIPGLIPIFEQICQGVAYAHSAGVVHRDLKPGNVMVGDFGEVQVMDWGLAKALTGDDATNSRVDSDKVSDDENGYETQRALGTYAYMPPEQALARVAQQDERCDVFSLGAILCEILTGRPIYVADTGVPIAQQAESASLAPALDRLRSCRADTALVTLATSCLAENPEARPRSASVVVESLRRYQADQSARIRRAEAARAAAVATAEQERHRRRLAGYLVMLAGALAALLTGGVWWRQSVAAERQAEIAEMTRGVRDHLERAEQSLRDENWDSAAALIEQLRPMNADAVTPELQQRTERARKDLSLAVRLKRLEEERTLPFEGKASVPDFINSFANAFRDAGYDLLVRDSAELAVAIRSSTINSTLVASLDRWNASFTDGPTSRRLTRIADLADPKPSDWKSRARDPETWTNRDRLTDVVNSTPWSDAPPELILLLAWKLINSNADVRAYLQQAHAAHPDDFWINTMLAQSLVGTSAGLATDPLVASKAVAHFRAALALRPESAGAHSNLALALNSQGAYLEAIGFHQQAIKRAPEHYRVHLNFGVTLHQNGDYVEAVDAFEQAVKLHPQSATALYRLGLSLDRLRRFDDAERAYLRSIGIEPQHADVWFSLGNIHLQREQYSAAIPAYRRSITINPRDPIAQMNLGSALSKTGDHAAAIEAANTAVLLHRNVWTLRVLVRVLRAAGENQKADELQREIDKSPRDSPTPGQGAFSSLSRAMPWPSQGSLSSSVGHVDCLTRRS